MNVSEILFTSELERTRELVQAPDWYLEFGRLRKLRVLGIGGVQAAFNGSIGTAADKARQGMYDVFEQLLADDAVRLGRKDEEELDNQDADRQPVDRIVIHHSHRPDGISNTKLSAMELIRLYVPVYQNPKLPVLNSEGKHQPIYSGHFDENGTQVFYPYHWKVQQNGESERLLDDSAIGWHAGNWEINKRSVGICIDDDLTHKEPTPASLQGVVDIIATNYSDMTINESTVIGHNEASPNTNCPGDRFETVWKKALLSALS